MLERVKDWDPEDLNSGPHPATGYLVASSKAVYFPGVQFLHLQIKAKIYDGFTGP